MIKLTVILRIHNLDDITRDVECKTIYCTPQQAEAIQILLSEKNMSEPDTFLTQTKKDPHQ